MKNRFGIQLVYAIEWSPFRAGLASGPAALGLSPKAAGIEPFQGKVNEWVKSIVTSSNVVRMDNGEIKFLRF